MQEIKTFEILDNEIRKVGGKPIVLEALWDGDTQGWYLSLYLYTLSRGLFNKRETRHSLGQVCISEGMKHFTNGKWTVSELAKQFGKEAIEKYNLTFYFPSEKDADEDCPRWTERHLAIHCADCDKLIIPTDSPYLPKDICYHCHLTREQNERVKQEKPCDGGVTMYLSKNDEHENIGYCTHFKDFTIAPFINDKVQQRLTEKSISIVILHESDILELNDQLEKTLNEKLKNYKKPEIDLKMKQFVQTRIVEYKGNEYELANRFNTEHVEISRLFKCFKTTQKAISENYSYNIYFKNGLTYRDDTVLRFVNYVCKGSTDIETINQHYKSILTESEVLQTVKKLKELDCFKIDNEIISITRTGRSIV